MKKFEGAPHSEKTAETPSVQFFMSVKPVERDDANFILDIFNAATGERKSDSIQARTKFEALWVGLYTVLQRLPKGTEVEIFTDCRPFARQFQELKARLQEVSVVYGVLVPVGYSRPKLRVWAHMRHHKLHVNVIRIPRSENRARIMERRAND